ncbi:MAG: metal-dependent hydrolase [Blastocatellia bacterium]|nr:metal-dependent hydrolase [Blastocatellia bacterium]MCS7156635.1 metal-dependent hydrolase [Blastocatellia bacterium]MCX7751623.1 metal-dependent hydrolase [Blastocatellia bacterium]MDW8168723.1 metal-dependent hydrolase [Acidobacteriota bacterium]MDW8256989.1 metal-dependent hydrolase [Acidobacteriota bacterium]
MDTITHGLITRLFAKAIVPERRGRDLIVLATICSVLPDVDILYGAGDPLAGLQNHRGFTHSLLGAVLLGFPLAALTYYRLPHRLLKRARERSTLPHGVERRASPSERAAYGFWAFYLASVLGIGSHIFFDLVTSYGTMILQPFSDRRFSLDLWFIIDPYVWLILSVPWLLRRALGPERLRRRGTGWEYRIAALLLVGYIGLAAGVQMTALRQLEAWTRVQGISATTIGAIPVAFSPLRRKGIVMTPDRVYDIPIRVTSADFGPIATYPSPFRTDDPFIVRAWATPHGKRYRWFARFPLAVRLDEEERQRVILYDLRFQPRWEDLGIVGRTVARALLKRWPELMEQKRQALEIVFDARGRAERIAFLD